MCFDGLTILFNLATYFISNSANSNNIRSSFHIITGFQQPLNDSTPSATFIPGTKFVDISIFV
jgi:hypothetical protein